MVCLRFLLLLILFTSVFSQKLIKLLKPSVLIVTLVRNKAHFLPYFFSHLENLNYPKDRIGLYIRLDHNEDPSLKIIDQWLNSKINSKPKILVNHMIYFILQERILLVL